ncbi:MAG: hypothetical protein OEZ58_20430 [Gammaproteobacteria bacterium]|nr:hypothetical protein [Gammaproteobacteria bacterium]
MKNIVLSTLLILFCSVCPAQQLTPFEKKLIEMYQSSDLQTRQMAFLLTAQTNSMTLREELRRRLPSMSGLERLIALYSATVPFPEEQLQRAFVKEYPTQEKKVLELLLFESGEESLARGIPFLPLTEYLAELAVHDDDAFKKLLLVEKHADGWMGDAVSSIIGSTTKQRNETKK